MKIETWKVVLGIIVILILIVVAYFYSWWFLAGIFVVFMIYLMFKGNKGITIHT